MASRSLKRHTYPKARAKPITPRSMPEEVFLDHLDRRLKRLDYELSPGFRGPRGREAASRSWWQAAPYYFSVLDGMSQPVISVPPDSRQPLKVPPPTRINDIQSTESKPHNDAGIEAWRVIRSESPQGGPATATLGVEDELEEGVMYTSAYIPRRPPMRARRSRTAEQALLYTDGRVNKPKILAEWQKLDRRQRHSLRRYLKLRLRAYIQKTQGPRRFLVSAKSRRKKQRMSPKARMNRGHEAKIFKRSECNRYGTKLRDIN